MGSVTHMNVFSLLRGCRSRRPSSESSPPTIEQLRGQTYAVFLNSGVRVDLNRYFSTIAGQRALEKIARSADVIQNGKGCFD